VIAWLTEGYRKALHHAIHWRYITVGIGLARGCVHCILLHGGAVGSEFLPHLDEGALWVRGTFAPSTGPTEGIRISNQVRVLLWFIPGGQTVTSQVGRPDDGTDTTGFFNTEYFVDLKPKEEMACGLP